MMPARTVRLASPRRLAVRLAVASLAVVVLVASSLAAGRKFYDDDPIAREPETQDASGAAPTDVSLFYELSYSLFVTAGRQPSGLRAQNINTIDEVPDSGWFTNRVGSRAVSTDEIVRGPVVGPPPAPGSWTIIREKASGAAPGFTARDSAGQTWFVSFDAPTNPEGATSCIVVASKLFWGLGYNQVESFVTSLRREQLTIDPKATVRRASGKRTPMSENDLGAVLELVPRQADGSYRVAVGRLLSGKVLGPYRYEGTRPDDPNDLVPHEHRRELRALRVFGAWTNLTDMKAGNTLDTLVTENGRSTIRHYLQDVGSTFGIGANRPHDWDEGWEYFYQNDATWRRFRSFGFDLSPWQTVKYEDVPAVGPFEGDQFDPETWRPHSPMTSYMEMRADDAFWAARRVMAFTDELIRAAVKTGGYSDPTAERHLGDVLIKRRDKIGRAYLTRINPVVDPVLGADGVLTFGNAAVQFGFAPAPERYESVWHAFDNATSESRRIESASSATARIQAPRGLPTERGSYVRVQVSAMSAQHPAWAQPIDVYFRRVEGGWKLAGLERLPETVAPLSGASR
jgi:hypothetical protein